MARSFTGLRIRERRVAMGITQAALAERAGISPSYLNLIEKNRRSVAGRVLVAIARELRLSPSDLSEGPERALIDTLTETAAARGADADRTEEFVSRFSDWAGALAAAERENRALRDAVAALSDRMSHDPFLGESVHRMLTNLTAIRSAKDILADPAEMPAAQRQRFLAIIGEETGRLTRVVNDLIAYFDRAETETARAMSPEEMLDRFLDRHGHAFPRLDENSKSGEALEELLDSSELAGTEARQLAAAHLRRYAEDARLLPLDAFAEAAASHGYDPLRLASEFHAPPLAVFRRLATLRRGGLDAPAFALLQLNAAGRVEMRRPQSFIALPRHGAACPFWPVFDAISRPETPVSRLCALPDGTAFFVTAYASATAPPMLHELPRYRGAMLILPRDTAASIGLFQDQMHRAGARGVGPGCRICPRRDCRERTDASILG